jgi:hypothetical protein
VQVTTTATQRITGSASVTWYGDLYTQIFVSLCYQSAAGGPVLSFAGIIGTNWDAVSTETVEGQPVDAPASDTKVPGAGTWNVGACIVNDNFGFPGAGADGGRGNPDVYVEMSNGWIEVTD